MKNTKFIACLLGLAATVLITLLGKMDGNVTVALSVVIGGFYGGNVLNTRAALKNGYHAEP